MRRLNDFLLEVSGRHYPRVRYTHDTSSKRFFHFLLVFRSDHLLDLQQTLEVCKVLSQCKWWKYRQSNCCANTNCVVIEWFLHSQENMLLQLLQHCLHLSCETKINKQTNKQIATNKYTKNTTAAHLGQGFEVIPRQPDKKSRKHPWKKGQLWKWKFWKLWSVCLICWICLYNLFHLIWL